MLDTVCDFQIDGVKFDVNYEAMERGVDEGLIEELIVGKTPSAVLKMLNYFECTIKFRSIEYFEERGKGEDVIGFFEPMNEIVVRSDISLKHLVGTIHHEIGHFIDSIISKYRIGYGESTIINGSSGKWMLNAMDRDSHIFKRNYYRDSEKEFFAQSYANYVMGSAIMDKAEMTKQVLKKYMVELDIMASTIGEDIVGLESVWRINNEVYMGIPQGNKRINFYLKENGYMISFKDFNSYKLTKYEFMNDGDYFLTVDKGREVKRYIVNKDGIECVNYFISGLYEDYLLNENISVIRRNCEFDFVKNIDGNYKVMGYSFNDILITNTDDDAIFLCRGDRGAFFMDRSLNVLKHIKGRSSFDIIKNTNGGYTKLFFFENEGKFSVYNERGEYSGNCLNANKFNMYSEGSVKNYLFIKYEKYSALIDLDENTVIKNKWDEIDLCQELDRFILDCDYLESEGGTKGDMLRMKKDGVWYIGQIINNKIEVLIDDYIVEDCGAMLYKKKGNENWYVISISSYEKNLWKELMYLDDSIYVDLEIVEVSVDNVLMEKSVIGGVSGIEFLEVLDELEIVEGLNLLEEDKVW